MTDRPPRPLPDHAREALVALRPADLRGTAARLPGPIGQVALRIADALDRPDPVAAVQALAQQLQLDDPNSLKGVAGMFKPLQVLLPLAEQSAAYATRTARQADAAAAALRAEARKRAPDPIQSLIEAAHSASPSPALRAALQDAHELLGRLDRLVGELPRRGPETLADLPSLEADLEDLADRLDSEHLSPGKALAPLAAALASWRDGVARAQPALAADLSAVLAVLEDHRASSEGAEAVAAHLPAWRAVLRDAEAAGAHQAARLAGVRLQAHALASGDHEAVVSLATRVGAVARAGGHEASALMSRMEEALALAHLGRYAQAEQAAEEALVGAAALSDAVLRGRARLTQSQVVELQGERGAARRLYQRALDDLEPSIQVAPICARAALGIARNTDSAEDRMGPLRVARATALAARDGQLLSLAVVGLATAAAELGDRRGAVGVLLEGRHKAGVLGGEQAVRPIRLLVEAFQQEWGAEAFDRLVMSFRQEA